MKRSLGPSRLIAHGVSASLIVSVFAVVTFVSTPPTGASQLTRNFVCTRSQEDFIVPADVSELTIELHGGTNQWGNYNASEVRAIITVTPGEQLWLWVGCAGDPFGQGGFPNGGNGGGVNGQLTAGGGGGSSSIQKNLENQQEEILAVAGGGGGGTNYCASCGGAGDFIGGDARPTWDNVASIEGKGGTQSGPGAPSVNFSGVLNNSDGSGFMRGGDGWYGAGGGGGYYGGSGGAGDINYNWGGTITEYGGAGGGGSSHVNPARVSPRMTPMYVRSRYSDPTLDGNGLIRLSWTPDPTTTTSTTTSTTSTTTTTLPPATTPQPPATTIPPQVSTIGNDTPSWSATPETESNTRLSGTATFPTTGQGAVMITNEMGFITTARSRAITPRWRTRFYIGQFNMAITATYREKGRRRSYTCTFAPFGISKTVRSTDTWRWYQPRRSCVLPKELFQQLVTGRATLTMTGTFQRRWATNNARIRPDRTRIEPRRVNIRINANLRTRVL
jgi:hypothetical protein